MLHDGTYHGSIVYDKTSCPAKCVYIIELTSLTNKEFVLPAALLRFVYVEQCNLYGLSFLSSTLQLEIFKILT